MSEVVEKVEAEEVAGSKVVEKVRASAHQIWLAGLGAYAKAEEEGVKVMESLIKEGEEVESRATGMKNDTLAKTTELRERANQSVEDVRSKVNDSLSKVEALIEEKIAAVVSFLGLASKSDVQALVKKVETLNKSVKALSK
jgi:poly(hydroxyalkanoate) granule-associated protein